MSRYCRFLSESLGFPGTDGRLGSAGASVLGETPGTTSGLIAIPGSGLILGGTDARGSGDGPGSTRIPGSMPVSGVRGGASLGGVVGSAPKTIDTPLKTDTSGNILSRRDLIP